MPKPCMCTYNNWLATYDYCLANNCYQLTANQFLLRSFSVTKKTQLLPTTWCSPVPIHDATKNIITRGPFTCTTNRVHCATHPLNPLQWVMLVHLAILIYQTWTCPSLPFVKDPTICESCSWTFPFLSPVTAAVLVQCW